MEHLFNRNKNDINNQKNDQSSYRLFHLMTNRMFLQFLLVSSLLSFDHVGNAIRIIGIFPDEFSATKVILGSITYPHWTDQSIGMFHTAMKLAKKYNLTFHEKPINYTIHRTRNSPNGFSEFDLVCNLITNQENRDLLGIIGPASSTTTRFLGMLAAQINMPMISYGATNNDLADAQIYQTFYRIAPPDQFLARAIVQFFELFSWKTCTFIIGNDDFGYGGLKILSEDYHSNITLRGKIMFNPQHDKFHVNLAQTIERSWSRIILVWANQSACSRIIQHALDANLLGGQYIWILTAQVNMKSSELEQNHKKKENTNSLLCFLSTRRLIYINTKIDIGQI